MEGTGSSNEEGQSSFILNKKPIPDVTLVVHKKSLDKSLFARIVQECRTPYFYHKFIIEGIKDYSKKYILKAVSNFVYPASFRALHYTVIKNRGVFLSRNCQDLVLKLCSEDFLITNPEYPDAPFEVVILANFILYEEVQVENDSQNIIDVITKRFNNEKETLDLSAFSEDEGLADYYPIFQSKFLLAITSKIAEFPLKHLILQNNCIRDISSLQPLSDLVESIDISNNNIEDISNLMPLINFKTLKTLILSGNPLCEKYDNYNYVLDVKRYCQILEKLDGFDVTRPEFQKNFLCTPESIDLVESFVEHFFTLYDSEDREKLIDLYDKNALFSVTARIVPNQKNSSSAQFDHYGLKIPYVIYGAAEIMKLFKTFPKTYHDPYPLVCDVTLYTDTHVSIVTGGILKERQYTLMFTRHFIFKRSGDQFSIINDQYHVSNALDCQMSWSFGFPMHLANTGNPLPYFQEEYRQLEEVVHEVTTMNYEHSQKYLDYCQYDLKKTLLLFSELHVCGKVPEEAFTPETANSKQLRAGVLPFSEKTRKLTYKKHKSVNLKTIWETLHSERIRALCDKPLTADFTIKKIYRNVIIPNLEESSETFIESFKSVEATSQPAKLKPISFNIQTPTKKKKPVQKVKPATKATSEAVKIANHKELAAQKANELHQIRFPDGSLNQVVASVPPMVPHPNVLPYEGQVNFTAANFPPDNQFVAGQQFFGHPVMMPIIPQEMPPFSGFPPQQRYPIQHPFPVPRAPVNNIHVTVPGRPNLLRVPRSVTIPVVAKTATVVSRPTGFSSTKPGKDVQQLGVKVLESNQRTSGPAKSGARNKTSTRSSTENSDKGCKRKSDATNIRSRSQSPRNRNRKRSRSRSRDRPKRSRCRSKERSRTKNDSKSSNNVESRVSSKADATANETTSSSSLKIERSPSGAIVSISTGKNTTGSGSSVPDIAKDEEYALYLSERKRRLDMEIQKGLEKIQKLTAQRQVASKESSNNEPAQVEGGTEEQSVDLQKDSSDNTETLQDTIFKKKLEKLLSTGKEVAKNIELSKPVVDSFSDSKKAEETRSDYTKIPKSEEMTGVSLSDSKKGEISSDSVEIHKSKVVKVEPSLNETKHAEATFEKIVIKNLKSEGSGEIDSTKNPAQSQLKKHSSALSKAVSLEKNSKGKKICENESAKAATIIHIQPSVEDKSDFSTPTTVIQEKLIAVVQPYDKDNVNENNLDQSPSGQVRINLKQLTNTTQVDGKHTSSNKSTNEKSIVQLQNVETNIDNDSNIKTPMEKNETVGNKTKPKTNKWLGKSQQDAKRFEHKSSNKTQNQGNNEEPASISENIPLVSVQSSDEEKHIETEGISKGKPSTSHNTENKSVVSSISSSFHSKNEGNSTEEVDETKIDSPIKLTFSSDEENKGDSDEELVYVGWKDIFSIDSD